MMISEESFEIKKLANVYHEPPYTIIPPAIDELSSITVQEFVVGLIKIDNTVPFDAEVIADEDAYEDKQDVLSIYESNNIVYIKIG